VAAVAAETKDAAEEAARLVRVEYEELPAVFTVADALAPDAPLVQDAGLRPNDPLAQTNVLRRTTSAGATSTRPRPISSSRTPTLPDGDPLRHRAARLHRSTRRRRHRRLELHPASLLAAALLAACWACRCPRCASSRPIRAAPSAASSTPSTSRCCAFMALRLGRPVRLVLTLEETFLAVRRTETEIHVRTGVNRDGTLAFQDIDANYLIGAYADIADRVVGKGSYPATARTTRPAARINARSVLSHTVPSTAFRGFGNPQINWAVESNLTEAALALGIDPLEFRLRNLARRGDRFVPFDTPCDGDWAQSVERAAELIGWDMPAAGGRGRGIALGIKSGPTTGLSYSIVRLLADGSAVVYAGTSDMGQGARTVFAQMCAAELGIPLERVTVVWATPPWCPTTSRPRPRARRC
jgi:CO/xanthine dehydrogenase Mo-binding subunit